MPTAPRPRAARPQARRQRTDQAGFADSLLGACITALHRGVRDPSRITLRSERRALCTLDELTVSRLGIRKGRVIDEPLAVELARAAELDFLRAAALRRVARSMCTAQQLSIALNRRGADKADAASIVADFQRLGLVNDAAFADAKARAIAASGRAGAALIESKLRAAGISRDVARAAAVRACAARDCFDDACRFAVRRAESATRRLTPDAARRRLFAALVRRGFEPATARRAVEHVLRCVAISAE